MNKYLICEEMLYHTCFAFLLYSKGNGFGDAHMPVAGAATGTVMIVPGNTQNLQQTNIRTLGNTHRHHAIGTHEAAV
jgi:hypothetical protein